MGKGCNLDGLDSLQYFDGLDVATATTAAAPFFICAYCGHAPTATATHSHMGQFAGDNSKASVYGGEMG
jgi:hypothetical protein